MSLNSPKQSPHDNNRSQHEPSQRRRWIRRLLWVPLIVVLLAVVGLLALTLTMRRDLRTSLPQIDGQLAVAGLTAQVSVTRDAHGVPTLHATTLDDLLFAQGYVTAQDRLWQMDMLRRHGAGELAEILGPQLVDHDRLQRYLQLRAAADRAITALPRDQMQQLDAYARGVNAFIASHPDTLPVEFHLLHYAPKPWSPRDSLLVALVMSQDLSTSFPQKLNREALSAHLPAPLLQDLYPVGSWRDRPPSKTALDLTAPTDSVEQIPLDKTQTARLQPPSTTPHDLLATFAALQPGGCMGCRAGSNNWAVSGAHTASGAPLLANDMHLGLTLPDIWYEASLHANTTPTGATLDVAGFTLPGMPFVIAGRNAHVAWGFTNTGSSVQDVRIEHLRGSGANTEYERPDGSWAVAGHQIEVIHVRAGRDRTLDVLTTPMTMGAVTLTTPVISPLYPSEHRALSLAWNVYDPATLTLPLLAINTAPDAASLVASCADFGSPSENLVYADAHHIGFHVLGRVPIRGLPIQRPRAVQQFILPDRTPESDEQDEEGAPAADPHNTGPMASQQHPAHLLRAGWKQEQIAPVPTTAYTIGSPISDVPVDALDPSQVWSGYIPYNELPAVQDPEGGVLVTANARVTPDNYPYFLNDNWADPYRAERIERMLTTRTDLHVADMLTVQTDVQSAFDLMLAQRLAYALDHASAAYTHNDPRLRQAADLLRKWDGKVTTGSAAAAIVTSTHDILWTMLLAPKIALHDAQQKKKHPGRQPSAIELSTLYTWGERTTALEALLQHTPARWLPVHVDNWNDFLAGTLLNALKEKHAPADLTTWHYGAVHPVEIAHPIFGSDTLLSKLLGASTGTGRQPNNGDGTTVLQTGLRFGPSERFTADLSDTERSTANTTTGQSGNPASPFYLDQFAAWLHGQTFAFPLLHPQAAHTLTLTPASSANR
jgi:penicillin amidase